MQFSEYQAKSRETAIYPRDTTAEALSYVALGLAGEAGEIANKVKKILRDDAGALTSSRQDQLLDEASDVLWYLSQLVTELGGDLGAVARANIEKLAGRAARGTLKGSGDNR